MFTDAPVEYGNTFFLNAENLLSAIAQLTGLWTCLLLLFSSCQQIYYALIISSVHICADDDCWEHHISHRRHSHLQKSFNLAAAAEKWMTRPYMLWQNTNKFKRFAFPLIFLWGSPAMLTKWQTNTNKIHKYLLLLLSKIKWLNNKLKLMIIMLFFPSRLGLYYSSSTGETKGEK